PPKDAPPAEPGSMAPQAARKKPPVVKDKTKPTHKLRPGDLICGQCGEGNSPSRKFCARCGNSLETAKVAKTPWWKKIIPHRKPKTLAAGERPGVGGNKSARKGFSLARLFAPLKKVIPAVLIIGALAMVVFPPLRTSVTDRLSSWKQSIERKITPQFATLHPFAIPLASSSEAAHPPKMAFDGFSNTYWEAGPGDTQPHLVVKYADAVNIDKLILRNGSSDNYSATNRVEQLHLVFVETGQTADVNVQDSPDPKTYTVKNGHGSARRPLHTIQIFITKQYPALQGVNQVAITELTFFQKK
ncbi:MAG TPA: hypothetical protein VN636_09400, partial [Acidimicrobiia bacterium]|nr:hypothetical protein [Acidimicrobiia bacterium]